MKWQRLFHMARRLDRAVGQRLSILKDDQAYRLLLGEATDRAERPDLSFSSRRSPGGGRLCLIATWRFGHRPRVLTTDFTDGPG